MRILSDLVTNVLEIRLTNWWLLLVATNWRAEILASLSPDLTKSALTRHMIYVTMINPWVDQSI